VHPGFSITSEQAKEAQRGQNNRSIDRQAQTASIQGFAGDQNRSILPLYGSMLRRPLKTQHLLV
jgi:hypothetical protein